MDDEAELRRAMTQIVRGLLGPGLVRSYYENEAEEFVQEALAYAEAQKETEKATAEAALDEWPAIREWLNGRLGA